MSGRFLNGHIPKPPALPAMHISWKRRLFKRSKCILLGMHNNARYMHNYHGASHASHQSSPREKSKAPFRPTPVFWMEVSLPPYLKPWALDFGQSSGSPLPSPEIGAEPQLLQPPFPFPKSLCEATRFACRIVMSTLLSPSGRGNSWHWKEGKNIAQCLSCSKDPQIKGQPFCAMTKNEQNKLGKLWASELDEFSLV